MQKSVNKNIANNLKEIITQQIIKRSNASIISFLIISGLIIGAGYYLHDNIVIIFMIFIAYFFITKQYENLLLLLVLWLYLSRFFVGQGWISNGIVSGYLIKAQLYIFVAFLLTVKKSWFNFKFQRKLAKWALYFLAIIILSDILHQDIRISAINQIYFILLFFLILYLPKKPNFDSRLLNLLISVGILQLIVSYLQVNQYIPPSMKTMHLSVGSSKLWIAGLDDVASGTFGADSSNVTSWFSTILFFFFFALGNVYKKKFYILLSFIFMLQYSNVDSKTALAVSAIAFIFLLKNLKIFNLFKIRNFVYIMIISGFVIMVSNLLYSYYQYKYSVGIERPLKLIERSIDVVGSNFWDWGKFAGFKNITVDHLNYNPAYILIGYGRFNYNYRDNSGRIEKMDKPLMKLNNITRSRSTLIAMYGKLGLSGLVLILWLFIILGLDLRRRSFNTMFGKAFKQAALPILLGSILFMFLYGGHTHNDQAFMTLFVLYALVLRAELRSKKYSLNSKTVGSVLLD